MASKGLYSRRSSCLTAPSCGTPRICSSAPRQTRRVWSISFALPFITSTPSSASGMKIRHARWSARSPALADPAAHRSPSSSPSSAALAAGALLIRYRQHLANVCNWTAQNQNLGSRMALGAQKGHIVWTVSRTTLSTIACGIIVGVITNLALHEVLEHWMPGNNQSPWIFARGDLSPAGRICNSMPAAGDSRCRREPGRNAPRRLESK